MYKSLYSASGLDSEGVMLDHRCAFSQHDPVLDRRLSNRSVKKVKQTSHCRTLQLRLTYPQL